MALEEINQPLYYTIRLENNENVKSAQARIFRAVKDNNLINNIMIFPGERNKIFVMCRNTETRFKNPDDFEKYLEKVISESGVYGSFKESELYEINTAYGISQAIDNSQKNGNGLKSEVRELRVRVKLLEAQVEGNDVIFEKLGSIDDTLKIMASNNLTTTSYKRKIDYTKLFLEAVRNGNSKRLDIVRYIQGFDPSFDNTKFKEVRKTINGDLTTTGAKRGTQYFLTHETTSPLQ